MKKPQVKYGNEMIDVYTEDERKQYKEKYSNIFLFERELTSVDIHIHLARVDARKDILKEIKGGSWNPPENWN